MDDKDRQIIAVLQENGRISNQELSEKVNLSPSPCLRRLRLLEAEGIIRGYTALIDEEAVGLSVVAFVRVRLQTHSKACVEIFEDAIRGMDAVVECHILTGSADYLLRVLARNLKDYEQFIRADLHSLAGVASIDTSFAFGHVKRSTTYPLSRVS